MQLCIALLNAYHSTITAWNQLLKFVGILFKMRRDQYSSFITKVMAFVAKVSYYFSVCMVFNNKWKSTKFIIK
jgi:hypothetical protein